MAGSSSRPEAERDRGGTACCRALLEEEEAEKREELLTVLCQRREPLLPSKQLSCTSAAEVRATTATPPSGSTRGLLLEALPRGALHSRAPVCPCSAKRLPAAA